MGKGEERKEKKKKERKVVRKEGMPGRKKKKREQKKSMGSHWGSNPGPPAQPQQPVIASRPQSGSWLAEENRPS